ncbi:Coenzyme F420 hydrogenase/dehydrogenase, beta subunit C-terminal domain [Butyrivibrio sp. WCE2006]|uniref:Coenzyme F420 hydrogenase/dehydrogenase, beta subunit C-terminal domain n=1 Tax=Butyrivibrio sp. WCE2006 TaxID=1410611 RepID=UPI0005D20AD1|nr:Coenzyme F420 hydrogenase/dehydrogenase, beta subunit C-terminal domain [Butyrivibrio sp. WCE2006]
MITPALFESKKDCCACGACLNVCPKQAISLQEDECGFLYPQIDESKCINCGACKRVCAYQNTDVKNAPLKCFAAVNKDEEQREKSASGGVFAAIATKVIQDGGIVYGAAFDNEWTLRHIAVDSLEELNKLQGSKYVQSNTGHTFSEVKEKLNEGIKVLYSGTPCQIAGLLSFLGKDYDNLITIDLVCHGVPNNRMFKNYISSLEEKYGAKVTDFAFRDKKLGWGKNASACINGKKIKIWESASPYLYYFSNASICRENCYSCKYAGQNRPADLTIGDFWGIEKQHPEYLNSSAWNEAKGISLIVANTNKGITELNELNDYLDLQASSFEKAAKGNAQLNHPSTSCNRDEIVDLYAKNGMGAIEQRFLSKIGLRKYSSHIKAFIPPKMKRALKRL